jgi:NADH dehydrogenase
MNEPKTRALIVGGGFAGVKAALLLSQHSNFEVTLLSAQPNFHYYPTLYHTATGGAHAQSSIPLAELFKGRAVALKQGTAEKLDRKKKLLTTAEGAKYEYDVLLLALGSVPNYFGIKGIREFSFSISTPDEARRFKNHLHKQLEDARKPDLNYVIVGGGPTGIELAGALPHYLNEIMKSHGIKKRAVHVDLVEGAPSLVPRMPARMGKTIAARLRKLGVKLYLNQQVEGATADSLTINGKPIQSHTVVWTAGTTNNPFFKNNGFELNERGKVVTDEYLQVDPDVFVLGDNIATKYSGMAQTALHDAISVAENLIRAAEGKLVIPYAPKEPIYVIPVGHNWASVLWGKAQIYGLLGWGLRLAADLVAFKDYQPWWRAGKQWMTEFESEEDCPTCANAKA